MPNVSITTLPAEELNEIFAAFLTEFVCWSLTSGRIKETLCFVSYLIMSVSCSPALPKKIYVQFHIKSGCPMSLLLFRRSVKVSYQICDSYFVVKWDDLYCVMFSMY